MGSSFCSRFSPVRLLLVLFAAVSLFTACEKEKDYSDIDEAIIKQYVADKNLTGAQRQPSGLYFVPLDTITSGVQPIKGNTVSVLYTGMLLDGTVFDSSVKNGGKPISFRLGQGQVIQGWDEGIALLHKGGKAALLIPSELAYGSEGAGGGAIPPNAVLRFDVQLVDVK